MRGIQNSTKYVRDTVVSVQNIGQPICCSFFTFSFCRDRDDLLYFDFVVELLERCVAKDHPIRQFFSPLPLLILLELIGVSLCLLLYLCFVHLPFDLHVNVWPLPLYTCTLLKVPAENTRYNARRPGAGRAPPPGPAAL